MAEGVLLRYSRGRLQFLLALHISVESRQLTRHLTCHIWVQQQPSTREIAEFASSGIHVSLIINLNCLSFLFQSMQRQIEQLLVLKSSLVLESRFHAPEHEKRVVILLDGAAVQCPEFCQLFYGFKLWFTR